MAPRRKIIEYVWRLSLSFSEQEFNDKEELFQCLKFQVFWGVTVHLLARTASYLKTRIGSSTAVRTPYFEIQCLFLTVRGLSSVGKEVLLFIQAVNDV